MLEEATANPHPQKAQKIFPFLEQVVKKEEIEEDESHHITASLCFRAF